MAAAKKTVKTTKVSVKAEEQIVNAEVAEAVQAKEEAHGVTEKSSKTRATEAEVAAECVVVIA